jgi:uncharacterized repeat protein (TIGR03803 family)
LYGTTEEGGAYGCSIGCGTIFKITPNGTLTTIYNFCSLSGCPDGEYPNSGLVQGTNGDLYGTTLYGGADYCLAFNGHTGCGTIFKITPDGVLTTLHAFCSQGVCRDGYYPNGLTQAANGDFDRRKRKAC